MNGGQGRGETRARACVLRAEGDGVEPLLVLQFEKGEWCRLNHGTAVGPPQYIFGAPEGLSRLLLTHRRILGENGPALPSPSLKAVFTSSLEPSQVGGLLGLFLRLKSDGHDKVSEREREISIFSHIHLQSVFCIDSSSNTTPLLRSSYLMSQNRCTC